MPLTKQIIEDVVKSTVKSELDPFKKTVNEKFDKIDQKFDKIDQKFDKIDQEFDKIEQKFSSLEKKIDNLTNIVTDFSGEIKASREEQTLLSGQMSDRTDRIEKLEATVFGSTPV